MKTTLLFTICLFLASQISIAGNSFVPAVEAGDSYKYYHFLFDESTFKPGYTSGNENEWHFQYDADSSLFWLRVNEASGHPNSSDFPSANLVITNDFMSAYDMGAVDRNYHFIKSMNDSYVKYGRVDLDNSGQNEFVTVFNNPETQIEFPLTLNLSIYDNWSASYYVPQHGQSVYWDNGLTTYEVDAIGTLIINGKEISNAYRVERDRHYSENAVFLGFSPRSAVYYEWYVEGIPFPVISMVHKEGFNNEPDTYEGYFIDNSHLANVGVSALEERQSEIEIYPNPSNGNINLIYETKETSHVSISVYNTSGMRVKVLLDQEQTSGSYHLNEQLHLPDGMYLINLTIDDKSQSQTVLIKDDV